MDAPTASLADIDIWALVVFAAKQWLPLMIGMTVWVKVVGWRIAVVGSLAGIAAWNAFGHEWLPSAVLDPVARAIAHTPSAAAATDSSAPAAGMLIFAVVLSVILRLIQLTLRLALEFRIEYERRLPYMERLRRMNRELKKGR